MVASLSELFNLKERVALVTGGAMGIGAQIAERLAQAGASVAIADVDTERAARVAERTRSSGTTWATAGNPRARGACRSSTCDVGNFEDVRRTIDGVVADLGRIDILVNNAGIFPIAPGA